MCEKVVESVFWPRWQVCTQGPGKRLKISPLPSTKLQWMLLWITAGCLFVCFSQTSKNCRRQPFRTCHRLAAIVTLVAISALTKLAARLNLSVVNFLTWEQLWKKIFLLELSLGPGNKTLFSICPLLGLIAESQDMFRISTVSKRDWHPCQPLSWISWLVRLALWFSLITPVIGPIQVLWN